MPYSLPNLPDAATFDRIAAALGPAGRLTYAPPHIYPMSAPAFEKTSSLDRPRPAGGPLGLYVHIPFCNYACSFCFYATRVVHDDAPKARYVRALAKELEWVEPGTVLAQLYVGGGTPTVLPPALLDELLTAVFTRFTVHGDHVHTIECSPESVTAEHLDVYRKHGIGRVSMGIQSLGDQVLDTVHRRHDGPYALAACDLLVRSERVVNIDLIYGLPGQTEESFADDFRRVIERGVHSVTAYHLRVNEKTPVARTLAEEERLDLARLVRWRAFVKHTAERHGFRQTRWHTFKRAAGDDPVGRLAARFEDLTGQGNQFGVGMSARSRLGTTVYRNHPDMHTYLDRVESGRSPVEEVFPLTEEGRKTRFVALTLGDGKSLDRAEYEWTFGVAFDDEFGEPLRRMCDAGLVEDTGVVTLSETGKLVHDLVTLAFYPRHVKEWLRDRERAAVASGRLSLKTSRM